MKPGAILKFRPWLATLLFLLILGGALVQADAPNRAALVVVHGNGDVSTQCVEFSEDSLSGYEILKRSGLDLNVESTGMGATICRIDGEGCTYPADDCFCQCSGGSDCIFWSYWQQQGSDWQFSSLGASNSSVSDGSVEGWVWGSGTTSGGGTSKPPNVTFDDICAPLPTDTPTPVPTATPLPTDTPTPAPTNTPKPVATPVIHSFSADRTAITAGESVTLRWDLSAAEVAYLRVNGADEGVISPGSKTVSPQASTVYTLLARNSGGESRAEVTISVNNAPPPPTATPLPTAAPQVVAAAAPAPTETPAPEPVIQFGAASLAVPAGACTNLNWSVENATVLYLDEAEVAAQSSRQVCPAEPHTYRLRAVYPGGERTAEVALTVTQSPDSATEAATVPPPAEPAAEQPTATPALAAAISAPTATPLPAEGARRFTVSHPEDSAESGGGQFLLAGGALLVLLLFVALPVGLLLLGGAAYWLKGRQSRR